VLDPQTAGPLRQLAAELEKGPAVRKATAARIRAVAGAPDPDAFLRALLAVTPADLNEVQGLIRRDEGLALGFKAAAAQEGAPGLRAAMEAEAAAAQAGADQKAAAKQTLTELAGLAARYDAIRRHVDGR